MSDELKSCPFCGGTARIESNRDWHRLYCAHDDDCALDADDADLMYPAQPGYLIEIAEVWNRRTTPVSAPMGTNGEAIPLPPIERDEGIDRTYIPLPGGWEIQTKGKGSTFRIAHVPGRTRWMVLSDDLHEPLEAMARDTRNLIEQHAERIRHLERELEQSRAAFIGSENARKDAERARGTVQSINTMEFQALAGTWCGASQSCDQWTRTIGAKQAWTDLIAYIDGRTAGTDDAAYDAKRLMFAMKDIDGFTTVEWDKYDYASHFASENGRDEPTEWDELMGVRMMIDAAMIAAAPTPLNGKEEVNAN